MKQVRRTCQGYRRLGFVALVVLAVPAARAEDPDSAERLLRTRVATEGQRFAERLATQGVSIETHSQILEQNGDKERESRNVTVVKRHGPWYVLQTDTHSPGSRFLNTCDGINGRYAFELRKNKAGTAWLLGTLVPIEPDFDDTRRGFAVSQVGGFRRLADAEIASLAQAPTVDARGKPVEGNIAADRLFDLPGFRLDSVSLEGPDGKVVQARFGYQLPAWGTRPACPSTCVLDFDLGVHCFPVRLQQSCSYSGREVQHEWQAQWTQTPTDSYTLQESIETKTTMEGRTKALFRIRSDRTVRLGPLPESDFTLTAFGFPEPGMVKRQPIPFAWMAGGFGVVCLGFFFFWRSRTQRAGR